MKKIIILIVLYMFSICYSVELIENIDMVEWTYDTIGYNGYFYFARANEIQVWDYSNPTEPELINSLRDFNHPVSYRRFQIIDDDLYAISDHQFEIWDLSIPDEPELIQTVATYQALQGKKINRISKFEDFFIINCYTYSQVEGVYNETRFYDINMLPDLVELLPAKQNQCSPVINESSLYLIDVTSTWGSSEYGGDLYLKKFQIEEETNDLIQVDSLQINIQTDYLYYMQSPQLNIHNNHAFLKTAGSLTSIPLENSLEICSQIEYDMNDDLNIVDPNPRNIIYQDKLYSPYGRVYNIQNVENMIIEGYVIEEDSFYYSDVEMVSNVNECFIYSAKTTDIWTLEILPENIELISIQGLKGYYQVAINDNILLLNFNMNSMLSISNTYKIYDISDLEDVNLLSEYGAQESYDALQVWNGYFLLSSFFGNNWTEFCTLDSDNHLQTNFNLEGIRIKKVLSDNNDRLMCQGASKFALYQLINGEMVEQAQLNISAIENSITVSGIAFIDNNLYIRRYNGYRDSDIIVYSLNAENQLDYLTSIIDYNQYYCISAKPYLNYLIVEVENLNNNEKELLIIDITNPELAQIVNSFPGENLEKFNIVDDYLMVSYKSNELSDNGEYECYTEIFNLVNIDSPELIETIDDLIFNVESNSLSGNKVVACTSKYIDALRLDFITPNIAEENTTIPEISLLNHPNPFNPATIISYNLMKAGLVEVAVYNLKGQKVKTLVHDYQEKGNQQITWNGENDDGNKVSSGIYFYRVKTGDNLLVKKMLLMK